MQNIYILCLNLGLCNKFVYEYHSSHTGMLIIITFCILALTCLTVNVFVHWETDTWNQRNYSRNLPLNKPSIYNQVLLQVVCAVLNYTWVSCNLCHMKYIMAVSYEINNGRRQVLLHIRSLTMGCILLQIGIIKTTICSESWFTQSWNTRYSHALNTLLIPCKGLIDSLRPSDSYMRR